MKKIFILFSLLLLTAYTHVNGQSTTPESSEEVNADYIQGKKYYDAKRYMEAYPLFLKAAEAGNSDAMMHLGKMYYNGWGVLHNHETGRMWHEKAAKLGNTESIRKLEKMDMHDKHH